MKNNRQLSFLFLTFHPTFCRQTKRDIEAHASDPSSKKRSFSLQLSSGDRLHMSLNRRSIDTSGSRFSEYTEEGERDITLEPRHCFFGGALRDGDGFVNLAMCDGEVVSRNIIYGLTSTVKIHGYEVIWLKVFLNS